MSPEERANLRFFRWTLIVLLLATGAIVFATSGLGAVFVTIWVALLASLFTVVDYMLGEDRKKRKVARDA